MSLPGNTAVYLDYAASAPVDPRVVAVMRDCLSEPAGWANPASEHAYGYAAQQTIAVAAEQVANLAGARPEDVIWTSGATEANNLGVLGAARFFARRGKHVVAARTEHKAVLESCAQLQAEGFSITYIEPDRHGLIAPAAVAAELRDDTVLAAIMHANNETGVIQDIAAVGALCRERGVLLHVDAAQSAGKLPLDMHAQSIDLLALSAHKICGPKGIGALVLNPATVRRVEPLLFGGGQQRSLRPGTLATHQIAGMGEAFRLAAAAMDSEVPRMAGLRDRLWAALQTLPGVILNGDSTARLCSILNITVQGVEGESLRFALRDIGLSAGSACNSASGESSYVLRSLGRTPVEAEASLRLSVGRFTTEAEIDRAADRIVAAVTRLRHLAEGSADT